VALPPSTSPLSLDQQVDVETPEQVVISYEVAGIGSRAAAALIDYAICFTAFLLLMWLMVTLAGDDASRHASHSEKMTTSLAFAILYLVLFVIFWGYYVFFEAIWDGQTPGKRRLRIRVVQDGGYSVSFAASAVRNLVRLVDMQPAFSYGVAIGSAALSHSGKRLGDYIAGTFVVRERITSLAPDSLEAESESSAPVETLLTEGEFELLDRFMARRAALDDAQRQQLAKQLADRFAGRLPDDPRAPLERLIALHARERLARRHGAASAGATGAARERNAIVAAGTKRWSAFAAALQEAQRRGLKSMTEAEVSEFVAQYREVSTDLARLQTASRDHQMDSLFYVSRLVGAGHNLLYRQRPLTPRVAWRYLTVTVPRELRRSALPIAIAAFLLFVPAVIAGLAVYRSPALAEQLLPPSMIDRAERGVQRAKEGKGYLSVPPEDGPLMASAIIGNNITVTYSVFAWGVTAGIGTVVALVKNGAEAIGAGIGLYAAKGILWLILAFVIPHSVLELTAICIAGGGGLLIGSALVLPGALTRKEAVVVRGRRAIRLIAAASLMLVFAGAIEGLISPRTDVPLSIKFAIAGISALFVIGYWSLGRGESDEAAERFAYSEPRAFTSR